MSLIEQNYKAILKAVNDAILIVDPKTGIVLDSNQKFSEIFGEHGQQNQNFNIGEISSNEPLFTAENLINKFREACKPGTHKFEWLSVNNLDQLIWINFNLQPVEVDDELQILAFIQEISDKKHAEQALRDSEKKWRAIAENVPDIIMTQDPNGKILFINHVLPGYDRNQIIGTSCFDYMPEEYHAPMQQCLDKVFQKGEPSVLENIGSGSPGELRYYMTRYTPMVDNDKIVAALAIATDITTQKNTQNALHKSEEKFSKAFYSSPDAIAISRLSDGKFIEINEGFERITGYSQHEALSDKTLDSKIWPDLKNNQEYIQSLKKNHLIRDIEANIQTKTGELRNCLFSEELIEIDGEQCKVTVMRDVTEQKKSEQALRSNEAYLAKAQQIAQMGSWSWDLNSNEVSWSDEMYVLYGVDKNTKINDLWDVIRKTIHPDDQEKLQTTLSKIIDDRSPSWSMEYRIIRPDGKLRHMWGDGEFVTDESGGKSKVFGIVLDITERKLAEQALNNSQQDLEERNLSLATINKIADRVYQALDIQSVAEESVDAMAKYTLSPSIAFFLVNEENNTLELIHSSEFNERILKVGSRLPINGSLSGITFTEKNIVASPDIEKDGRLEPKVKKTLLEFDYKSAISIPLLFQDQVLGIMNLIFKETHPLPHIEYDTLLSIGKTIGLALGNARYVSQTQEEMHERKQAEETLRNIAIGVSSATGNQFFRSLVTNLATTFKVDYAFLGIVDKECDTKINTVAVHAKGEIVDNFTYNLKDTPCANVMNSQVCAYPEAVQDKFPKDQLLVDMGVNSYIGTPLFDSNNKAIGLFVVLDSKPLRNVELMKSMLQIFAVRAAAEIERIHAEQALRRSEEHLRLALNASGVGTWEWDIQSNHVTWSNNVEAIFQLPRGSFSGSYEDYMKLVHKEDIEIIERAINDSLDKSKPYLVEHRIVTNTGHVHWLEGRGEVYRDDSGNPVRMRGTVTDITDKKQAAIKLKASQKMLELVMNSIPVRVFWKDLHSVFLGCNKLFALDAGLNSPQEIIGKNDYDMVWREQADLYRKDDQSVIKSGKPKITYEEPQTQNGRDAWLETSKVPLTDLDGNIIGILGTYSDITERKIAIEEKRQSQQKLGLHIEQTPLAVIGWNINFEVVEWNPAAEKIFGYKKHEAMGRNAADLILTDSVKPHVDKIWDALLHNKGGQRSSNQNITKDGRLITCEWYNTTLVDEHGRVVGVASAAMDVTDRIRAEQELIAYREHLEDLVSLRTNELTRVNKELEAFSYSVSHDLRAPLRSIDGFSQALVEDYSNVLDDTAKDYLYRVRSGAQRMAQLIDDMLKLSRLTRSKLKHEQVNLSKLAKEIAKKLQSDQPKRSVEFHISPDLLATGDEGLLRVVMDNLINNAWKYTSKVQHAVIDISGRDSNDEFVYKVQDNGIGFNMEYVDKLFGAFQRLHRTNEYEGSGIGLATVARIVHRHGGRVWAEGEENQGASFYFALPKTMENSQIH